LVVAGTNGAGKTTLIELLPAIIVGDRVDPDQIALTIRGGAAPGTTLAAGRIALQRISAALQNGRDLTIETTLAGHQPLELVARARKLGYHVSLIFVGTSDARLNVDRIRRRIEAGGHAIAEEDVYRRYTRSLEHLFQAAALADSIAVYDNSGEPRDLRVIYDRDGRRERTVVDAPAWFTGRGALPHPV
jgi:predicted ABC-type ATPase